MKKLTTLLFILVFAGTTAFAQNNSATSTSNGDYNTSTIEQDGSSNTAEVMQSGTSNSVMVDQGIQGITSNNDEAYVEQTGIGNNAELSSRDGYGGSSSSVIYDVTQAGNYNHARLRAFNAPAEANVDQAGTNNYADITQHTSDDMLVELSQSGVDNWVDIDQTHGADNAVLQATISGDYNTMDVEQTNGAWQKLVVDVSGSSNTITGTLGAHDADQFTAIQGDGNTFDFYQDKSSDAGISVFGDYNDINLMQNGTGNSVFATVPWDKNGIVVNGMNNTVDVTQNSDYNTAVVNVSGAGNNATINQ
jgi:hypothetical protein